MAGFRTPGESLTISLSSIVMASVSGFTQYSKLVPAALTPTSPPVPRTAKRNKHICLRIFHTHPVPLMGSDRSPAQLWTNQRGYRLSYYKPAHLRGSPGATCSLEGNGDNGYGGAKTIDVTYSLAAGRSGEISRGALISPEPGPVSLSRVDLIPAPWRALCSWRRPRLGHASSI